MTKISRFRPAFVELIPEVLERGVLYVSMRYRTASHLCASGCGEEVVTPLSRRDWTLEYDGEVTLRPSIGNWGLPCLSHYFIRRNDVVWARRWSEAEIAGLRAQESEQDVEERSGGNWWLRRRVRDLTRKVWSWRK